MLDKLSLCNQNKHNDMQLYFLLINSLRQNIILLKNTSSYIDKKEKKIWHNLSEFDNFSIFKSKTLRMKFSILLFLE